MLKQILVVGCVAGCLSAQQAPGPDQTKTGAGNAAAATLAGESAMVQSAFAFLQRQMNRIQDSNIRFQTIDAFSILQMLVQQELINPPDAGSINGGMKAGVFPALVNDGSNCPTRPMPEFAAPGGATDFIGNKE